ncbi:MAG TPA: toll/interleukin-1 receptor domain-containing protein [Polyangia bacterium]|jgi:hypothetical protein|nr:toll/interleukin-1 receptor domain-containing protein [Polyangia bacterium]
MGTTEFEHDVFISFAHEDATLAAALQEQLARHGLRVWLYTSKNRLGEDHERKIGDALRSSQYFVVLVSRAACTSIHVKREHDEFKRCEEVDPSRKIFRLKVGTLECPELLPLTILHATTIETLVPEMVRFHVEGRRGDSEMLRAHLKQTEEKLADREKEAFGHYRRSRFWRQLVQDRNVHIFTCGRDAAKAPSTGERPGRTTIDKWDYRTVLDITHFLNRHYPATQVTIEDPVSKLRKLDLEENGIVDRVATLHGLLRNKTCIVVGSPDVSDFAEIVLARTHNIKSYHPERVKQKGYVIVKDDGGHGAAPSSHYWTTTKSEKAGVAHLMDGGVKVYPSELDPKTGTGEMHGVLAVVSNPFSDTQRHDRVVLLSGFSGVATNGIAKFLTDDRYLDAFGEFDRDYVDVSKNIEVLISVRFSVDSAVDGDSRAIQHVRYQSLVEL